MSDFKDDTILARWLAGELSEKEERQLRARPEFAEYEQLAQASRDLPPVDYDTEGELKRLNKRIRSRSRKARHRRPAARKKMFKWGSVAAALFLLGVMTFLIWPEDGAVRDVATLETAPAETELLQLDDGTEIRVNAATTLAYRLTAGRRRVELEGEAYFDVAHDPERPFYVNTPTGEIRVVGTSFNVFDRQGELRVACNSGAVSVAARGRDFLLEAGQSVSIGDDTAPTVSSRPDPEQLDWLDGRSEFRSRPLSEIIAEMERQFDLSVTVPPGLDTERRLTTSFTNDDVNAALRTVFGALPDVAYTRDGRQVVLRKK